MNYHIGIWGDNATHVKKYSAQVGAFVVNFGFLEYLTFQWITCLQQDTALVEAAAKMPLNQRITLVKKLAARMPHKAHQKEAIDLWKRVTELCEIRNTICHNPYMFGWASEKDGGDPDIMFTPHIPKILLGKLVHQMPKLKDVTAGADESGKVANRLFALILEHMEILIREKQTSVTVTA